MIAMLFTILYSNNVRAQLLKKIINTVKNTADNRINDKAAQSTNQVFDKVDGTTKTKSTSNTTTSETQEETASTNKVLVAFAKAAQQNPNDTSAADVTMKALGILVGGGGVSAAERQKTFLRFI